MLPWQELNSRSRVVEDAVLELIELVLVGVEGGIPGNDNTSFLIAEDLDDGGDLDDSRSGQKALTSTNISL